MERIAFSAEELRVVDTFRSYAVSGMPLFASPVSARENYLSNLRGEGALWLPMTSDSYRILPRQLPDNPPRGFPVDGLPGPVEGYAATHDMFGIDWLFCADIGGSIVRPGNPLLDTMAGWEERLNWPEPDSWDWAENAAAVQDRLGSGRARVFTQFTGYFERLISFMDFEQAIVALIDEDEKPHIHRFFDKLTTLYMRILYLMKQYYRIDSIELHDDWGSQRAPLFSPHTVREMILPYLKRLVDYAHSLDILFELHSCGRNAMLAPVMVEAGVDLWQPQQTANDTEALYREFGDRLTIGINCPLGPDAGEEETEAWVRKFLLEHVNADSRRLPLLNDKMGSPMLRTKTYALSRRLLSGESI